MNCGGGITVYGLFPETDITEIATPCDWAIYPRPECLPPTDYERLPNALEFGRYTYIPIPFSSLITDPTQDIKITFDFYPTLKSAGYVYPILEGPSGSTSQVDRWYASYVHRDPAGGNYLYQEYVGTNSSGSAPVQTRYENQSIARWFTWESIINNVAGTKNIRTLDMKGYSRTYNDPSITSAMIKAFVYPTLMYPGGRARDFHFNPILIANIRLWQGEELLGYWPIDEGEGANFFDRSGNGNHITGSLGDPTSPGVWVDAPYFNSTNLCLHANGDAQILIPITAITTSNHFWRIHFTTRSDVTDQTILLNTVGTSPGDSNHLLMSRNYSSSTYSNGHLEIGAYSDDDLGTAAGSPRPNRWVRETFQLTSSTSLTHSTADILAGFTNSTYSYVSYSTPLSAWTRTPYLQIGQGLVGKIREISVFNTSGETYPNAYYVLDDGPTYGGVLTDRSGNGHHGILDIGTGTWETVW